MDSTNDSIALGTTSFVSGRPNVPRLHRFDVRRRRFHFSWWRFAPRISGYSGYTPRAAAKPNGNRNETVTAMRTAEVDVRTPYGQITDSAVHHTRRNPPRSPLDLRPCYRVHSRARGLPHTASPSNTAHATPNPMPLRPNIWLRGPSWPAPGTPGSASESAPREKSRRFGRKPSATHRPQRPLDAGRPPQGIPGAVRRPQNAILLRSRKSPAFCCA